MGTWSVTAVLDSVDISTQLTGRLTVDAEEGAARTAEISLVLDPGVYDPADWIGKSVTIDYTTTWAGSARRFTGRVDLPILDRISRTLTLRCSDGLQATVEAETRANLDTLIGGYWSADLFDEEADNWTYAQDQLSTVPVSLELSPAGALRLTPWGAAGVPDYTFDADGFLWGGPTLDLASGDQLINRIDVTFNYRWTLLRHRERQYGWGGAGDFCTWFADSHELPTQEMVQGTAESTGTVLTIDVTNTLPPSDPEPCPIGSPGIAWFHPEPMDVILSANWTAARRTSQVVTETYRLRVESAGSIINFGLQPTTDSGSTETEYDTADWERDPASGTPAGSTVDALGDDVVQQHDRVQMQAAMDVLVNRAYTRIREAHRRHRVEFQVPLDPRLDLVHTVRVNATDIDATGKVAQLVDELDFGSGEALTTVRLAISRGDGGSALTGSAPTPPAISYGHTPPATLVTLSTQLGGRTGSPAYDDQQDGFAGNYSANDGVNLYPRRFAATGQEIEAEARDPLELVEPAEPNWHSYGAGVPTDPLTITL